MKNTTVIDKLRLFENKNEVESTFTVTETRAKRWSSRPRTLKIYVHGNPDPEEFSEMERPKYGIKGEDPSNDQAWKEYNRAEVKIMKHYIEQAMGYIQSVFPNIPEKVDIKYDRKAGCSCGCSPGFKTNIVSDEGYAFKQSELFINVDWPERIAARKKAVNDRQMEKFDPII